MDQAMKLTETHVIEKAREILEDARRLGYFMFKCGIHLGGACPLKLSFAKIGSTHYVRQLGWARFLEDSGGKFTGIDQGLHLKDLVESFVLSADGISPWSRARLRM